MMNRQILVPLDGSPQAEAALPHAALLARSSGSTIRLLRTIVPATAALAWPMPVPIAMEGWVETERTAAQEYLAHVTGQLHAAGLGVETTVTEGRPAEMILTVATDIPHVREIVMASHGRRGLDRWVWGSVAEKVLRATPVPLLVVPVHEAEAAPEIARPHPPIDLNQRYRTILVALDGSPFAEQALDAARRLAMHCGATLVLLSAIPSFAELSLAGGASAPYRTASDLHRLRHDVAAYLARIAGRLAGGHPGAAVQIQTRVVEGSPAEQIMAIAAKEHADLVVMATHGRGGLSRLWLGSVAARVIEETNQPVLLIRAEEERTHGH